MPFEVLQVPVWRDNYAHLLIADDRTCALVDGPDATPLVPLLEQRGLTLTHVFVTHHHADHVGSHAALIDRWPDLQILGSAYDLERGRIPGQTRGLRDGETVAWGGQIATVREVPGHTLGHLLWSWSGGLAFVGDTLFVGGCGRLFEGTAEQLDRSLNEVIAGLPPDTLLYCAHEYTTSNLRFARRVDPDNTALADFSRRVADLRSQGLSTVPQPLSLELAINPFLRCDSPAIRGAVGLGDDAPRHRVLGALRSMKDGDPG
jgi:hydroxyacylglutathione hydrolase